MDITPLSLNKTVMDRMREKYGMPNPEPNTWIYNHRLEVRQRKIKWNELKQKLNKLPGNFQDQIKKRIESNMVKIIRGKSGAYYEYMFFIDGWECALISKEKEKPEAYYEAWNSHDGLYYKRDLLELDMYQL